MNISVINNISKLLRYQSMFSFFQIFFIALTHIYLRKYWQLITKLFIRIP